MQTIKYTRLSTGYNFCCMMAIADGECQFTNAVKIVIAYIFVY